MSTELNVYKDLLNQRIGANLVISNNRLEERSQYKNVKLISLIALTILISFTAPHFLLPYAPSLVGKALVYLGSALAAALPIGRALLISARLGYCMGKLHALEDTARDIEFFNRQQGYVPFNPNRPNDGQIAFSSQAIVEGEEAANDGLSADDEPLFVPNNDELDFRRPLRLKVPEESESVVANHHSACDVAIDRAEEEDFLAVAARRKPAQPKVSAGTGVDPQVFGSKRV